MRILVVDDEPEILTIISSFLTERGYSVTTAGSGDEALAVVDVDADIDVVLLDVVMAGRNGIDILRDLMRRSPHPHVIMMTARADEKIFEAVRSGAVDYLLKPIDFAALETSLAASINRPGKL